MARVAEQIIRLGLGFIASQALRVVADLEIADRLAGGAKSVDALSVETGTHTDALYRIMRVLAAEGVFREPCPDTLNSLSWAGRCVLMPLPVHATLSG
jgi:hypothetical protein